MTSVGLPGSSLGLPAGSPTLAGVLKEQGYATGQFGNNHLGDINESLPTLHGFDEFFGNHYHLNAEEIPEQKDYPQDPAFKAKYGPRGVLHSWATDVDDETVDPRFGKVGKQKIEDTGPLSIERMKGVDEEFMGASLDFLKRAQEADKPWFVWPNPSRMHLDQHLSDESRYLALGATTEEDVCGSGMIEHDKQVGEHLDKLKAMGELDNTIVIWCTDNGPDNSARVHGGTTPFRGELTPKRRALSRVAPLSGRGRRIRQFSTNPASSRAGPAAFTPWSSRLGSSAISTAHTTSTCTNPTFCVIPPVRGWTCPSRPRFPHGKHASSPRTGWPRCSRTLTGAATSGTSRSPSYRPLTSACSHRGPELGDRERPVVLHGARAPLRLAADEDAHG